VLGPLEARDDSGQPLAPGRRKQRLLLALLLLRANTIVPVATIADGLWGERPPRSATANLQSYLSDLRRLLGTEQVPGRRRLQTGHGGYVLHTDHGELDATVFETLAEEGRRALQDGLCDVAHSRLTQASALWRGAVVADLTLPEWLQPTVVRLHELQLAVLENHADARLALGRHAEVATELVALTEQHPLRERLWAQLMLALYRSDRQADALAAYQRVQRILARELGIDPGRSLHLIHKRILASAESLNLPAAPVALAHTRVPRQLPPIAGEFVGRDTQLIQIRRALASDVPVVAITGRAGVGKSAVAVRAAHLVAGSYPDGQLYLDLRGTQGEWVEPGDALAAILRSVGVAAHLIPDQLDERAALYRTWMSGQRVLLVLDNAADEAQIRPLLPAAAGCSVLATSRIRMAGLDGAHLLDLDVLPDHHAVDLLHRSAQPGHVNTRRHAAEIVRLVGRLPLALRIVAARLAARPDLSLRQLAARLAREQHRLDELVLHDLSLRASLTPSYRALPAPAREAFRRLGLLPTPTFTACEVSALVDAPLPAAELIVDELVDARLVDVVETGATAPARYRLHELLHLYARERANIEERPAERRAALIRVGAVACPDHGAA